MEAAARGIPALWPSRRSESIARELEQLRALGEAYLLRRFGHSLSRADAEDAVADVVIRLHRRIEMGQAPRNLRAAFFTSVRNAAIDQFRYRQAKPTVALEAVADTAEESASPSERAESGEDSVRLQEALARMRGNYREALVLRFGVGLTVPEIAARLEISLPAAKKLVLRATEQARKRLMAIEGEEFCPAMRDAARASLFDRELSGLAGEAEREALRAHFSHCGSCKSFLHQLHRELHELGGTALLAGAVGNGGHLGLADHVSRWLDQASDGVGAATAKLRLAAYKASGAFQGGDGATVGALGNTAQKVAAVCGTATAATATCVATGIVGPGIAPLGVDQPTADRHPSPPPIVRPIAEEPPPAEIQIPPQVESPPAAAPPPSPQPTDVPDDDGVAPPVASQEPLPAEVAREEFGFEASTSSASEPASAPAPEPAPAPTHSPAPAPAPAGGGGGGGGGGGESFGFGG